MAFFVILGTFIIGAIEGFIVFWLRDEQMIQYLVVGGLLAVDFLISIFMTATYVEVLLGRKNG